jgi:hypothetical protein
MTASTEHRVVFNPNPVQRNFIESKGKADLFSSRMGEGKSTALCWAALYHTRHNPGARWALIRDTFENIVGTTQKTFFQWFPPGVFGEYNHTRKTFKWASGIAEGEVEFLGMDDQHDASKLMSREFAGFGIDEPAPAVGSAGVDEMIFDLAMSRLRQPGMKWYGAKLAENNPDEAHWTYRRFVNEPTEGFQVWQPNIPENVQHLPKSYYAELRGLWKHRPDLIRRFVDGEFGFQSVGKSVTPQWNDKLHLSLGLAPIPRSECILLWDFGHNPTCIITQRSPLGQWLILNSMVGEEGMAVEELIENEVIPLWQDRYAPLKCTMRHTGDPAGNQREQTSIKRSAVKSIRKLLAGPWRSGPVKPEDRFEPLRAVLTRTVGGKGLVQVDRENAPHVWHSLRGGWHFHVARTGLVSGVAVKDKHSHPGDAMGYGAALLFPVRKFKPGELTTAKKGDDKATAPGYFGGGTSGRGHASALDLFAKRPAPPPAGSAPKSGPLGN